MANVPTPTAVASRLAVAVRTNTAPSPYAAPASPVTQAIAHGEWSQAAALAAAPTLPVTVWLVDDELCAPYTDFVRSHGEDSLYHALMWRHSLERAKLGTPLYLLALRGDAPVGVLPLMQQELAGGRRWSSLPGTPAAGPLAADPDALTALTERALTLAFTRGGRHVTVSQWSVAVPADHEQRPRWVRVPLRSLAAYVRDTAASTPSETTPDRRCELPDETQSLLLGPPVASRALDLVLMDLGIAGGHPRHVLTRRADDHPPEMAVWLTRGHTAHLLGYRGAPAATARRTLFARVLERLADEPATHLDLALPHTPDAWTDGLLRLPDVCVAREQPLTTGAATAFQATC
jgi:hypothetical protein